LQGNALSESLIAEAAEQFGDELDPIDDVHASAEYRRRLAPVVVRRMVARAWQRGREE
jgi:carbon-monoxide dehydrogenase medium subunit